MSMSNQSDPSVGDVLLRQILPLRHAVERGHNQVQMELLHLYMIPLLQSLLSCRGTLGL